MLKAGHCVYMLVFGIGQEAQLRARMAASFTTATLNECAYAMHAVNP